MVDTGGGEPLPYAARRLWLAAVDAAANKDLVRRFAATLSAGDLEGLRAFFDDDSTWTIQASDLQGAGTHRGRAIIDEFLRPVREGLFVAGDPKLEVTNLFADGTIVIMEAHGVGLLLNGNAYDNRYAFVFEIEGTTIRRMREYMDTHHAHVAVNG